LPCHNQRSHKHNHVENNRTFITALFSISLSASLLYFLTLSSWCKCARATSIGTRQRSNFIDSCLFSFVVSHRNLFQAVLYLFQSHLSSEHLHTYYHLLTILSISYLYYNKHECNECKVLLWGGYHSQYSSSQPLVRVRILHKHKPDLISYHDSVP